MPQKSRYKKKENDKESGFIMKLFTSLELTQDTPVCNITSLESTLYHPTPLTVLVISIKNSLVY